MDIIDTSMNDIKGDYTKCCQVSVPHMISQCHPKNPEMLQFASAFKIPKECDSIDNYFSLRIELVLAVKKMIHLTMSDCNELIRQNERHSIETSLKVMKQLTELSKLYSSLCLDELIDHPSHDHASKIDKLRISSVVQTHVEADPYVARMRHIELPSMSDLNIIKDKLKKICDELSSFY
jgi:hypothetical protein